MDLIKTLTAQYMKPELPAMRVGDTVRVTVRVTEGNRERTQAFEGTIIAKKHGGINETITVRRIDQDERPDFEQITRELDGIVQAAMQLKYARGGDEDGHADD